MAGDFEGVHHTGLIARRIESGSLFACFQIILESLDSFQGSLILCLEIPVVMAELRLDGLELFQLLVFFRFVYEKGKIKE